MNKGLSKFDSRVPVSNPDARGPVGGRRYPEYCEVPGCDTHWVPGSNGFPDRHERGKTDVVVPDSIGELRGMCGEHYIRGLIHAGKHPNQNLMNTDGSMSPVLVKEHWAKLDAEAKP